MISYDLGGIMAINKKFPEPVLVLLTGTSSVETDSKNKRDGLGAFLFNTISDLVIATKELDSG